MSIFKLHITNLDSGLALVLDFETEWRVFTMDAVEKLDFDSLLVNGSRVFVPQLDSCSQLLRR